MLKDPRAVRAIAAEISDAANGALEDYKEGDTGYEVDITGRLVGAIRDRLRSKQIRGIDWRARSLRTGRGVGAEEGRHGADLLGVLDVDVRGYRTKKGFLAQAKRAEPGGSFDKQRWEDLVRQCNSMLSRTPDSFVFIYSTERRLRVFPAISVLGLKSRDIFDLYDRGLSAFFESYIECFIGDPRLNSTEIATLDALVDLPVRHVLELSARSAE